MVQEQLEGWCKLRGEAVRREIDPEARRAMYTRLHKIPSWYQNDCSKSPSWLQRVTIFSISALKAHSSSCHGSSDECGRRSSRWHLPQWPSPDQGFSFTLHVFVVTVVNFCLRSISMSRYHHRCQAKLVTLRSGFAFQARLDFLMPQLLARKIIIFHLSRLLNH